MFDRYDLLVGLAVLVAAFGTIVHHDGSIACLIPNNRDIIVVDVLILVVTIFGGSVLSFCARGKLRFDEP